MLDVARIGALTNAFLQLKRRYFPGKFGNGNHLLDDILVEIKGFGLRSSIRKHGDKASASLKFIDDTLAQLRRQDARLFASIWVKGAIGRAIDSRAIYTTSIQALCPNFSAFLEQRADVGFMVADFRTRGLNCQVSHSIFTEKYRVKGDPLPRLLELPTFGQSDNHAALQVADLLTSALLLPMATATYCQGHIRGKQVRGRDKLIKRRYASRLKPLQSRYKRGETTHGGAFVSDRLEGHRSDRLFQFED